MSKPAVTVTVTRDGPYEVSGAVPIAQQIIGTDRAGKSVKWEEGKAFPAKPKVWLCRCGHSAKKPYCDGSHSRVGFDGTETASRQPYLAQAKVLDGPMMQLTDAESLCAFARFCDPRGQVWAQVAETDDPEVRRTFVKQTCDCPSGRLVAWDKATGKAIEPELPVSIGLVEDPQEACSGPLWLRGGIAVIAEDGFAYEVRNRVTLCRCGASQNKPYCDGSHAAIKFTDGIG
ncbi:CDGSH iron-sulfur domain-containing protein [Aestuariivirga sp.]|uniref:CDGSH iron-sulfur domain-containing protein n=1 Tax=Aestuariivirga sp. TaxID=2650926 RepID=UPI0039E501B2